MRKEVFNVNFIKLYLKNKGLSKTEFCKIAGVSVYLFNKILSNDGRVGIKAVLKIADVMQVSILNLFCC